MSMARPLPSFLNCCQNHPYLVLFVLAAVVHAAAAAAIRHRTGSLSGFAFASLDSGEYYRIAQNLLEHRAFTQSERPPFRPDTWRTPGYPLFLAAAMSPLGDSATALVVVQQFLGVLTIALFFAVSEAALGRGRALAAAVALAVEPYRVYYSFWLLSTTLLLACVLAVWLCRQRLAATGRLRWAIALGGAAGYCVLIWPGAALVPIVVGLDLLWEFVRVKRTADRTDTGARLGAIAAAVVTAALIVGGWMARNQQVAGHFSLSDQSGVVMAYFKATEAILWREGRTRDRYLETSLDPAHGDQPHRVWDEIDARLRGHLTNPGQPSPAGLSWKTLAQGNRSEVDSFQVSRELRTIAWQELLSSPGQTILCLVARCAQQLIFPLDLAVAPPNGVPPRRSQWLLLGIPYTALASVAALALVRSRSRRTAYFPLMLMLSFSLAATPQLDPRFRVPMIPMMLVVALMGSRGAIVQRP